MRFIWLSSSCGKHPRQSMPEHSLIPIPMQIVARSDQATTIACVAAIILQRSADSGHLMMTFIAPAEGAIQLTHESLGYPTIGKKNQHHGCTKQHWSTCLEHGVLF